MLWDISDMNEGSISIYQHVRKTFRIFSRLSLPNLYQQQTRDAVMTEKAKDQESNREDLDHKPENAGKIGEKNKQMNEKGEQPRPGTPADPKQD